MARTPAAMSSDCRSSVSKSIPKGAASSATRERALWRGRSWQRGARASATTRTRLPRALRRIELQLRLVKEQQRSARAAAAKAIEADTVLVAVLAHLAGPLDKAHLVRHERRAGAR